MGSSGSSRNIKSGKDLAMLLAVKEGNIEELKLLMNHENWKCLRITETRWTLLHLASWFGQDELCKELINLGADLNEKDVHQETPLHLAVFRGHIGVIKVLVLHFREEGLQNIKGQTPLDLACHGGSDEIITIIQEWTRKSSINKSTTINIVDL